jgi:hypothetical protein
MIGVAAVAGLFLVVLALYWTLARLAAILWRLFDGRTR